MGQSLPGTAPETVNVLVGCCGTAGLGLEAYAGRFPLLEVESTFYKLPRRSTAERWRTKAPSLVFTLKAFQGVTHPADSPTWRRARSELEGVDPSEVGMLRASRFVKSSWERTLETAGILKARIIVVQLPPSYHFTEKNAERLERFVSLAKSGPTLAVEFRHESWLGRMDEAVELLERGGAILITDPLKMSVPDQPMQYHRLHGTDGFVNYRHRYTQEELERLARSMGEAETFMLFDNLSMRDDAERFRKTLFSSKDTAAL